MRLTITSIDPEEVYGQVSFAAVTVRELPGPDRPDYWLAKLNKPVLWLRDNKEVSVSHLVIAARWTGTQIQPGVHNLPVSIAYVTDETLLADRELTLSKCAYVAIGLAHDTTGGRQAAPLKSILAGRIARFFGMGSST